MNHAVLDRLDNGQLEPNNFHEIFVMSNTESYHNNLLATFRAQYSSNHTVR